MPVNEDYAKERKKSDLEEKEEDKTKTEEDNIRSDLTVLQSMGPKAV